MSYNTNIFTKPLFAINRYLVYITKLIELKGNYEGIPYVDVKKEWAFVEKTRISMNFT